MPVTTASAPWSRLRLRQSSHLRDLCAETTFTTAHLIQPIFIVEGLGGAEAIPGLDGNERLGIQPALDTIARDVDSGVRHFLLFAVPEKKGSGVFFVGRAVDAIKKRFGGSLCLWVDVCLCSTTVDGHVVQGLWNEVVPMGTLIVGRSYAVAAAARLDQANRQARAWARQMRNWIAQGRKGHAAGG